MDYKKGLKMKIEKVLIVSAIALSAMFIGGCELKLYDSPYDYFQKNKSGYSNDYALNKNNVFGNKEHVVTVHGFGDDESVCRVLASALMNHDCEFCAPGTFFCEEIPEKEQGGLFGLVSDIIANKVFPQ